MYEVPSGKVICTAGYRPKGSVSDIGLPST
jgi:hypothetical protein